MRLQITTISTRIILGVAASLLMILSSGYFVDSAMAGSYTVVACNAATADNGAALSSLGENNSWETYYSNDPTNLLQVGSLGANCQSSTDIYVGLGIRDNWEGVGPAVTNGDGYWQFDAPLGTAISNVSIDRNIGRYSDLNWIPYVAADGTRIETCVVPTDCTDNGSTTGNVAESLIQIGVACDHAFAVCNIGATRPAVWAIIYGASITLSEDSDPSLTVSSDSIANSGYVDSGTASVSFDGTDPRGIKEASIELNGVSYASESYDCDYTQLAPCGDVSGESLQLDYSTVPEGSYTAELVMVDAAGNESSEEVGSFTVDSTAPSAPNYLGITGSQAINSYSLSWSNPSSTAPITTAYYKICSSTGECGSTQSASGTNITQINGVQVPAEGTWNVYVWLEDGAGKVSTSNAALTTITYRLSASGSTQTASTNTLADTLTLTDTGISGSTSTSTDTTKSDTTKSTKTLATLKLKVSSLKRARYGKLRVTGSCSKAIRGKKVTVTYKPKQGGSKLTKKVLCTKGKWAATLQIKRRKGGKVTATYTDPTGRKAATTRKVKK